MKKYAEAAPIAINFTVDVDQGITVKPKSLTIQQGEHNARYFQVSLVHNEMPVNLANSEVHFLTQPHKSDEIPTTTNCEIYDAENGQVMVAVKDYMSNKSGIINGEFVRIGEDGSSLPFKNFTISVDGSIFVNDGLGQSEPLHSLVSALARVQRVEEYLEQEFMDVEAKYAGELSKTNAQLSQTKQELSLQLDKNIQYYKDLNFKNNDKKKLIAHRGFGGIYPENTIYSFKESLKYTDEIEFDVMVSSDGKLIIIHDDTVDRTTNGTGSVKSKTLAELKTLDAGYKFYGNTITGIQIPSVDDLFNSVNAEKYNWEIKGYRTIEDVDIMTQYVIDKSLESKVEFSGFFWRDCIPRVRALTDKISFACTVDLVKLSV